MAGSSPIVERLRRETAEAHAAVERPFSTLLTEDATRDDYASFLVAMSAFHGAIEPALDAVRGWDELTPPLPRAPRRKLSRLAADLDALGLAPSNARCVAPTLADLADALGAAYVIEGSTLGARVLHRHLVPRLGLAAGATFLAGYGSDTGAMWRSYVEAVTSFVARGGDAERVVAAARATFGSLLAFLSVHSS